MVKFWGKISNIQEYENHLKSGNNHPFQNVLPKAKIRNFCYWNYYLPIFA